MQSIIRKVHPQVDPLSPCSPTTYKKYYDIIGSQVFDTDEEEVCALYALIFGCDIFDGPNKLGMTKLHNHIKEFNANRCYDDKAISEYLFW